MKITVIALMSFLCGCYYSPWEDCRYVPAGEEYVSEQMKNGTYKHYTFRPEVVLDKVHFEILSNGTGGEHRHAPHSVCLQSCVEEGVCRTVEIERLSVRRKGELKETAVCDGKVLEFSRRKTFGLGRIPEGMIAYYECVLPMSVTPKDGKSLLVEIWVSVTNGDASGKSCTVKGKIEFVLLPDVRSGWFQFISV